MTWLHIWWERHWQKSWSMILIAIDGVNIAALQFWQQDIVQFFGLQRGPTVFSILRMSLGALIFWRASTKKSA